MPRIDCQIHGGEVTIPPASLIKGPGRNVTDEARILDETSLLLFILLAPKSACNTLNTTTTRLALTEDWQRFEDLLHAA